MSTFLALLTLCVGNSTVTGEFATQRLVTQSFEVFFDLCLNIWLSKNRGAGDLRRHRVHYDDAVVNNEILDLYELSFSRLFILPGQSFLKTTMDLLSNGTISNTLRVIRFTPFFIKQKTPVNGFFFHN